VLIQVRVTSVRRISVRRDIDGILVFGVLTAYSRVAGCGIPWRHRSHHCSFRARSVSWRPGEFHSRRADPRAADHVIDIRLAATVTGELPIGYCTDSVTRTSWEGRGVAPDLDCPADDAIDAALAHLPALKPSARASARSSGTTGNCVT